MIGVNANDKNMISMFSSENPAAVEAIVHFWFLVIFPAVQSFLLFNLSPSKIDAHGHHLFFKERLYTFWGLMGEKIWINLKRILNIDDESYIFKVYFKNSMILVEI